MTTIRRFINGSYYPSLTSALHLALALRVTVDHLFSLVQPEGYVNIIIKSEKLRVAWLKKKWRKANGDA